jgi:sigma-B regulation protein RsbU (phosphoserine phosphatase)
MTNPHDEAFPTREHLLFALDAARMGTWSWDAATGQVVWDAAMEARYGLAPGEFERSFGNFLDRVHPDDRETAEAAISGAQSSGTDLAFEHRTIWPDGSVHWIEGRGRAVHDDAGTFVGMVGVGIDIDERRYLEEIQRQTSELRATAELTRQLEDAQRIARIGSWRWERDSNIVALSAEMRRQLEVDRDLSGDEMRELLQLRTHPDDAGQVRADQSTSSEQIQPFSYGHRIVVHGETRQVLHRGEVLRDEAGEVIGLRGTTQDVTEQRRAEENLLSTRERLVRERRAVEVLHDALIRPDFPEVPGFGLAARYLSAEVEADIGGDWYDAFSLPDGRVLLAVGDVSGHGIRAARLMAKLRHATRAYATIEPSPARILTQLDRFLAHFCQPEEFATVQLAALDPVTGALEMVSGGHPLPLVIDRRTASFVPLDVARVVGLDLVSMNVVTHQLVLEPGQALLFYTDGLVERRGATLARYGPGEGHLETLALDDIGATADAVCDAALDRCLLDTDREDDVCVLAVLRHAR